MVKKLSKILVVFLVAVFSLTSFNVPGVGLLEAWASNGEDTVIYYDGNLLGLESIIKQDEIFMASAAEMAYQTGLSCVIENDSIELTNDILNLNVEASVGSSTILVNGTERIISAQPEEIDGAVMFPVSDFFYIMNCSVKWDKINNKIIVNSPLAPVYKSGDIVINEAVTAPVIDGVNADTAWNQTEENSGFSSVFYMEEPESDTSFKITYDDEAIYLLINCEGAPVPLEAVSFFIAPDDTIKGDTPYYNAVLVPEPDNTLVAYDNNDRYGGVRIQYASGREYTLKKDIDFNAEYSIGDTSWTAEVKIPYESLVTSSGATAPAPVNAAEWKFNITRVRPFTETASSWVPIRTSIYGDNLIVNDCSYVVTFMFTPTSNRTGSIFFEEYSETDVFDGVSMPYINDTAENPGMRYTGYTSKLFFFNKPNGLNVKKTLFRAEWIDEMGNKYDAEIIKTTEKNSKLYFLIEHPKMTNEGLYRLNIYTDKDNGNGKGKGKIIGKGNMVRKYEMLFDSQQVADAGVIYNSFIVDTFASGKDILEDKSELEISAAAKALIRIMPECIGYSLNGSPGAGSLSYDASTDSLIKINGGVETFRVTRTVDGDGNYVYTTTPSQYANNGSMTLTSRTGKQVTFGYYEDGSGNRYFLDAQLNAAAEDYIKGQLPSLAQTDPVGAAYVMYYLAKAYQDWMPKYDYYNNASPLQWNWGPPFGYFSAVFHRWNYEELTDLTAYAPVYSVLKGTNAFDIVSEHVGEDADELITKGMFHDNVEFFNMFPNQNQNMNYKSWQGLVALGKGTGNPDYVHQAIDMVDRYAKNGFLLDGFWKEVTLSYHVQSLNGINNTINSYLNGWSDPVGYLSPRTGLNVKNLDMSSLYPILNASNLVQSTVVYPTGRWFPVQDTWESDKSATITNLGSILLPAANIARMSKGEGGGTSQLYMTYAPRYGSHCHYDPLSIALWSKGQELLPDLGYTHSQLHHWTLSTLGHNTVVVNSKDAVQPSSASYGGKVENYANIDSTVQVMKASQENAYAGITDEYNREPWYIKMEGSDESYILDIFRVGGGSRHEYTLNGDGTSKSSSFTTDIPMENYNDGLLLPSGAVVTDPTSETDPGKVVHNGQELYYAYAMVQDVKEADLDSNDGKYEITMITNNGTADTAGMKITGFADENSQLFIGKAPSASGLTRTASIQTPKVLMPKMVVRRDGTDLQSTFVNIMEPYAADSSAKITSVEKINTTNPKDVVIKVTYPSNLIEDCNITDVIISNSNPSAPLTIGDITLNGKMAFVRYLGDVVSSVYTVETDSIIIDGETIEGDGKYTGKVIGTMRKTEGADKDAFIVNAVVPDTAIGKIITITHPDGSVHAYTVAGVTTDGLNTVVEITGGDPGFNIFEDGSSKLLFYPQTEWEGDHTFKIAMDTVVNTGAILYRTKQKPSYYTATERENALNNISQGYSWAVDARDSAVTNAAPYIQLTYDELWSMVTPESLNNNMDKILQTLIDAYLYTGEQVYAKSGLILLDRIADIYPSIEFFGTPEECKLEQILAKAYDAFYPVVGDTDVIGFLTGKSSELGLENSKSYSNLICVNIEDNIIRQIRDLSERPEMIDNNGMQQAALAIAAVVLDNPSETTEWLDFVFKAGGEENGKVTGGDILPSLINNTNSDGFSDEASPEQNRLWADMLGEIANSLDGYSEYTKVNLYENPAFLRMYTSFYKLTALGKYTVQIGDSGETGVPWIADSLENAIKGFEKTRDPELAQIVYYLNGNSFEDIHSDIFSARPENIAKDIVMLFANSGKPSELESSVLPDYGFSILRNGEAPAYELVTSVSFNNMTKKDDECTVITKYFSNGATQFESTAAGNILAYYFEIPEDGNYNICFTPYRATSYGIYDIYVDGVKITTIDFCDSTTVNSGIVMMPGKNYSAGTHVIKFVCTGKNEKASNYKMGIIDFVTIQGKSQNDTQQDIWMYFGDTGSSTSHRDQLNLGIHAYGLDLAPDLGAPTENTSQSEKDEWISNTISHNTVVVDYTGQQQADNGNILLFDDGDGIQAMEVESTSAYPQAELYRRSTVMIDVYEQSYFVDFFRVKGGNDHTYSFHSTSGTVTEEGLNLLEQNAGTYAGESIEFGTGGYESGYQWLDNVRKDTAPSDYFSIDYDIEDSLNILTEQSDVHINLTMLGDYDDVAVASGYTPNKDSNLDSMQYVLVHRTGNNLESVFTSVIEPYQNTKFIESIEEAVVTKDGNPVSEMEARAVKITLRNGRVDYIISALDNSNTYTIDGEISFYGTLGVYSVINGNVITSYIK